jgi:hypothetical protein
VLSRAAPTARRTQLRGSFLPPAAASLRDEPDPLGDELLVPLGGYRRRGDGEPPRVGAFPAGMAGDVQRVADPLPAENLRRYFKPSPQAMRELTSMLGPGADRHR